MSEHMRTFVPNVSLSLTGSQAVDIRPVMVANIAVGDRERSIDKDKVNQIFESFMREGQLQPIGVKRQKSGEPLLLVFGHHRLLAARKRMEIDPKDDVIAAAVFPADTSDEACKRFEIIENLARKELTAKERDAHTTLYAGLLKKEGLVVSGKAASGATRSKDVAQSLGNIPQGVAQKVAKDLGIHRNSVGNRVSNARKLAARAGVTVETKTIEKMSGDELTKIGEAARRVAEQDRIEASAQGIDHRKIKPQQPTPPNVGTVRLHKIDPTPFIAWCRKHINGGDRQGKIDTLKAYRTALDDLITEIERS